MGNVFIFRLSEEQKFVHTIKGENQVKSSSNRKPVKKISFIYKKKI